MNSVDIDIGGTFTDCFVQLDGRSVYTKSPTTGHNLSLGFLRALEEAAVALGVEMKLLLSQTAVIRYSTTLAMNKLIGREGPVLGLITTEGFEDLILIGKGAQWDDGLSRQERRNLALTSKPEPLIPRKRIVGVKERVDYAGAILRPIDEEDVREKLTLLVDEGVRGIVVSLLWAHRNPTHEFVVKRIVEEEYPEFCLGYVPVVLSHEVLPKKGEYRRTVTAVLNAYLNPSITDDLAGIRKELGNMGYKKPILMVHNSGGMAEVAKTRAVDTFNGGPIAGLVGSLEIAKLYGFQNVITTDMGGTSFDIGMISEGRSRFYETRAIIGRWMVGTTMIEAKSIGAGGGSIARVIPELGGRLEVGPGSAGSMPGPVCYNLGGSEPTVTDADVLLGYINPGHFHGGKIKLRKDLAAEAVEGKIASLLGLTLEEAAGAVRRVVDSNMGNTIFKETVLSGYDPREYILFSFGGAGPTHCCSYAAASQLRRLIAFPFSPVFCAFSGSLMDIRHIFEVSRRVTVLRPGESEIVLDRNDFNAMVDRLVSLARDTARGEGLDIERLMFVLELDMKYASQLHVTRIRSRQIRMDTEMHVAELLNAFMGTYSRGHASAGIYPQGGVNIESFVLHSVYPFKNLSFPVHPLYPAIPTKDARKGKREVFWEGEGRWRRTSIFDQDRLRCGNVIEGPAVIEADDTTLVLPLFSRLRIDKYRNYVIELEGQE